MRAVFISLWRGHCILTSALFFSLGGKGTPRRKAVRKPKGPTGGIDGDKKLQNALKKLNVQPLTGIEEVNMFKDDGNVLHFQGAKGESN